MARHISEASARQIRERYEWLKDLDQGEADPLTPSALDAKVANEFGVSVSSVKDIIMGITHGEAGGPIDQARRTRRDLFARERETLGDAEARRRLQLRARNIDPAPKVERLVQRITVMDSKGRPTVAVLDLQPGESIHVELVPVGGDR